MHGKNVVDEELKRGFGLSIKEIEPFLRAGGDAAEMKFMECCHYLWKVWPAPGLDDTRLS